MRKIRKWNTDLNVGIAIIDNQHKIIFDLINDLCNAIESLADKKIIDTLFDVTENYVFRHFESEEEIFKNHKGSIEHSADHYLLIKEFHKLKLIFRNINNKNTDYSIFLENWFIEHITQKDVPFFAKISMYDNIVKIVKTDEYIFESKQRRRHKRIVSNKITDNKIIAICYNTTNLKSSNATIVDISLGGMRIIPSDHYKIGDILIVSCTIGKSFKMKEKIRINNIIDTYCGAEFIGLSPATEKFLVELYGAVSLRNF